MRLYCGGWGLMIHSLDLVLKQVLPAGKVAMPAGGRDDLNTQETPLPAGCIFF